MLEFLCITFTLFCTPVDVPPKVKGPGMDGPKMHSPTLHVPSMRKPKMVKPTFFDPTCDVTPPREVANDFYLATRRYPFGVTDCQLARQANAECTFGKFEWCKTAKSPKGAIGVMQFKPKTAKDLGIDPTVPKDSIYAGARYINWCRDRWTKGLGGRTNFDIEALGLVCYNWGLGNMRKSQDKEGWVLYITAKPHFPLESRNYVKKITRP